MEEGACRHRRADPSGMEEWAWALEEEVVCRLRRAAPSVALSPTMSPAASWALGVVAVAVAVAVPEGGCWQ